MSLFLERNDKGSIKYNDNVSLSELVHNKIIVISENYFSESFISTTVNAQIRIRLFTVNSEIKLLLF